MDSKKALSRVDWLVFVLSIYVVVELYVSNIIEYSSEARVATEVIDFAICLVFIGDFAVRLWTAPAKWRFLAWNWLDLVGSVPFLGPLRVARVARIVRVLRLARSGSVILRLVHRHKAASTFRTVLLLNVVWVFLAAIAVYHVEHGENPLFETMGDTIWWALVAVTTLGFEGVIPVTLEGRVFALLLVAGGLLLVGTLIGMIADYFVGDEEVLREVRAINTRLDRIERTLGSMPSVSKTVPGEGTSESGPDFPDAVGGGTS